MNFKNISLLLRKNVFGYICPCCYKEGITAQTSLLKIFPKKKNKLHYDGYYIKCLDCKLTTPIFKSCEEAEDYWELYFFRG